ncbi:MAG: TetR family transcriptional regulator [Solirubrobacterales bacterium]|nr:TetR family transcriptional regulator [Solirubrobacterales bacterium]OJU93255.1 MAG: hypothetical protein BGO23_11225 [Solirubrobacterales bacterium 67-14]
MTSHTRSRIKDAALNSFAEIGYHATSMRRLAEDAEVQASAVYHWYPNKEALLVSIMDDFLGGLNREVLTAVEQFSDPVDRFAAAVRVHVSYHGLHRRAAFVTDTEVRALTGPARDRVLSIRDNYEQLFYHLITDGIEAGQMSCRNPRIATLAILLECTGVAVWFRPEGDMSLAEIADIHVDIVLGSLNVTPAARPV